MYLIHEPLFLFHAYVKKFGLIKNLIKSQEVSVPVLMPRLRVKGRKTQNDIKKTRQKSFIALIFCSTDRV